MLKTLTTTALLIVLVLPALASAKSKPVSPRLSYPTQQVPFPDGPIHVSEAHCPASVLSGGGPCFAIKNQRIYLGRTLGSWRLYLLAHEIGHLYDFRHLSYAERRQFVRALNDPHVTRWNHPVWERAGAELFAEVYSACLRNEPGYTDLCLLLTSFKP